jgi:hypothetical protein
MYFILLIKMRFVVFRRDTIFSRLEREMGLI